MAACNPTFYKYYIIRRTKISDSSISYKEHIWDKTNKTAFPAPGYNPVLDADFFPLQNGSIIDVFQVTISGQSRVRIVQIDYSLSSSTKVKYIDLLSTSGDIHNILLKASITGSVLTINMYAKTVKEVTTINYAVQTGHTLPLSGMPDPPDDATYTYDSVGSYGTGTFVDTPCFNSYSNPNQSAESPIDEYCIGFDKVTVWHNGTGGISSQTETNSSFCGWVDPGEGGGGEGGSPPEPLVARITEEKTIKINQGCFQNPIYLTWKNNLGGWDYWLFEKLQTHTLTTESLGFYRENYDSISDTTNPDKEIGKIAIPKIIIGAQGLTIAEKEGISQMLYSPKIYILEASGDISREVKVSPGSFQIKQTDKFTADIEIELIDVEINTVRN